MKARKSASPERRRAGRPRSEASRVQVMEAAYKLLRKRSPQAISTQEIAAGAGVSTATLYRWWDSKEAILLDAVIEHVQRALPYDGKGSAVARLRDHALHGAAFLTSADGHVVMRLLASLFDSASLRRRFLESYYLPRRALELDLVRRAIREAELPEDTDLSLIHI